MSKTSLKTNIPLRTCVGCFEKFLKKELIAITRLQNGNVVLDTAKNSLGRSVYLCRKISCFNKAVKRRGQNALQYGLKTAISTGILEELEKLVVSQ